MKKSLRFVSMAMFLMFWAVTASAQCTPDPSVTDPEGNGEMVPDTLEGWVGTPMNLTLSIICPVSAEVAGNTIPIHHITIKSIINKPGWMTYACNPASGEYAAGVLQCALVTGTPTAASLGYTSMGVLVDVYLNAGGTAILAQSDYDSGMPMVLLIHPEANVEEIGHSGFGLLPAQPNPFNDQMRIGCFANDHTTATLNVFDVVGNVVYTESINTVAGNNYFMFSGSELSNGVYFYTLSDNLGNAVTRKMMKTE